jgi:hypothetical protein
MRTTKGVSGVSTVCRGVFGNPTQMQAAKPVGYMRVCWVCWVCLRACACAHLFSLRNDAKNISHATPEKANQPNTLNTYSIKGLIYRGFLCVGFVSGMGFLCWVDVLLGAW